MSICVEAALGGKRYIWGAPTYDQTRIAMDETRKACGAVASFNISTMLAQFPMGGRIYFRSLDNPDNVRGHTADGIVIDEAGKVNERAWYEIMRPMLIDTGGGAWIMGTPLGRNWFWKEYLIGQSRADTYVVNAPTLGVEIVEDRLDRVPHPLENPDIPFGEIQNLFNTLSRRTFRQEILAEFIEDGSYFSNVLACATAELQTVAVADHHYTLGVDWARASGGDDSVFTVLDATTKSVAHITRLNGRPFEYQLGVLKDLWLKFNRGAIIAEYNALGMKPVEDLQSAGLPVTAFTTTAQTKHELMTSLALAFEKKDIAILDDVTLTGQLQAFEVKERAGLPSYSAPEGMHDDYVMSLAFAWHGAFSSGRAKVLFEA